MRNLSTRAVETIYSVVLKQGWANPHFVHCTVEYKCTRTNLCSAFFFNGCTVESHTAFFTSVGFNLSLTSKAGQFVAMVSGKLLRRETRLKRTKNHIYCEKKRVGSNRLWKVRGISASGWSSQWWMLHNMTRFHCFDCCVVWFDRLSVHSGLSLLEPEERPVLSTRLL